MPLFKKMCAIHKVAVILLLIGGVNWLLVGLAQKDLFEIVGLGMGHVVSRAVYILVGLSALSMFGLMRCCIKGCVCADAKCSHCSPTDKKPMAPPAAQA